jgi:hypothetical protein
MATSITSVVISLTVSLHAPSFVFSDVTAIGRHHRYPNKLYDKNSDISPGELADIIPGCAQYPLMASYLRRT